MQYFNLINTKKQIIIHNYEVQYRITTISISIVGCFFFFILCVVGFCFYFFT